MLKYINMKKLDIKKQQFLETVHEDRVVITPPKPSAVSIIEDTLGYKSLWLNDKLKVLKEDLDKYFEPLENMIYLDINTKTKKLYHYPQIYHSEQLQCALCVSKDMNYNTYEIPIEEDYEEVFKQGELSVTSIHYKYDSKEKVEETEKVLNNILSTIKNKKPSVSLVIKTMRGFSFRDFKVKPLSLDVDKMYNNSFKGVDNIIQTKLNNSSKGVILLHGKAGTGKTNYIKWLTTQVDKKFIFVPANMINFLSDPSFIGDLVDMGSNTVLILEDCESYIKERSLSSGVNVVSTILNFSDGILSDIAGIQMICTFNTDVNMVDKALLRKGRLIAEYKFDNLEEIKAKELLEDPSKYNPSGMTLADIFNINDATPKTEVKSKKIGFGS